MKRLLLAFLGLFALHAQAAEQLIVYNWGRLSAEGGADALHQGDRHQGQVLDLRHQRGHVRQGEDPRGRRLRHRRALHLLRRPHASRGAARGARQVQAPEPQEPRSEGLEPALRPGNAYSVPYLWGSTGIAVRPDRKGNAPDLKRWADLWKPELKRQLLLIDDVREVFMMALRVLGYSGNTRNEAEIEAAYNKLKELMPNVKLFNAESPKDAYLSGEVRVGMIWNGEAYMAQRRSRTCGS